MKGPIRPARGVSALGQGCLLTVAFAVLALLALRMQDRP